MKLRVLGLVAALMMASPALAAWDVDAITQQYKADGFTRIEIKIGPTQAKVEAIKDGTKVEVIYDLATGDELKRESEVISTDESSATGVSVRNTARDFLMDVGALSNDDDDDSLDDNGRDDDDDSADDNSGRGGNDDEDDDSSDDNSGGDDDGPDHDSGDDNGGSDNSGSGSSGDDDGDDESDDD